MTRAAFVLGFLLIGLLVPTEVAQAQGRLTKRWRVGVEYLSGLNGVSFCRDEGAFYLVKGGLSQIEKAATEAHEAKHLEQYTRFTDCRAFYKYYDTPKGKLEMEAEAFAAGWCVQTKAGADPMSLRAMHIQLLLMHYVPGTPVYEVAQAHARHEDCR
jgi:hypothetical protein